MIVFEDFGEHKLAKNKQENIRDALVNCTNVESFFCWLNMIYNNQSHFYNPSYSYDTHVFLKEIAMICASPTDKLVVLGGVHSCTGHQSGLVLYQKTKNKNMGAINTFVSDTYIRFTIKLQRQKRLFVLNETQVFHFLVDVPNVIWIPGNEKKGYILLYSPNIQVFERYYPKVGKGLKFLH